MKGQTYIYSDDSKLLGDSISKQEVGGLFLEIGVGNGGNLKIAKDRFDLVVGTDIIDLNSVKRENPFAELIIADRASCFRNDVFDIVSFNPPYVPSDGVLDQTVDGGPNGVEVPIWFLESALSVVRKSGKILMLLSSECNGSMLIDYCNSHSISVEKIAEKRIFFESLQVYNLYPGTR